MKVSFKELCADVYYTCTWVLFLVICPPHSLSLETEVRWCRLGWLVSESRGLPLSTSPALELEAFAIMPGFLSLLVLYYMSIEDQTRVLILSQQALYWLSCVLSTYHVTVQENDLYTMSITHMTSRRYDHWQNNLKYGQRTDTSW